MRHKVKRVLKLAKGYRGRSKNCFRLAIRRVLMERTGVGSGLEAGVARNNADSPPSGPRVSN